MDRRNNRLEHFSAADFLLDESFLAWCRGDQEAHHFWKEWILAHPEKAAEINEAKRLYRILHGTVSAEAAKADAIRLKESLSKISQTTAVFNRKIYMAAAVITLLLICGAVIYWSLNNGMNKWFSFEKELVYDNGGEAKKTILLPDSSTILLNRFSTIRIDPGYGEEARVLELLSGSAYFEVRHDAGKPFIVKSGSLQTTALGTTFLVRANSEQKRVQVSLVDGKVKVAGESDKKELYLLPGERALASAYADRIEKKTFNIGEVENWKNNVIEFTNSSFEEVVRKLEVWYDVEVHVEGGHPGNKHYTARFEDKSLQSVMEAISYSQHFRYHIEDNDIFITFE